MKIVNNGDYIAIGEDAIFIDKDNKKHIVTCYATPEYDTSHTNICNCIGITMRDVCKGIKCKFFERKDNNYVEFRLKEQL